MMNPNLSNDSEKISLNKESSGRVFSAVCDGLNELFSLPFEDAYNRLKKTQENSFLANWALYAAANWDKCQKFCFKCRKADSLHAMVSYYLSRILYQINSKKATNVFAWCGISAVKAFKDQGFSQKKDYDQSTKQIVSELIQLPLSAENKFDQILISQICHFRMNVLGTEEHLASAFQEQQRLYQADPENLENLRSFGWILHDCLKQSIEKLKNRRLVEFFSSELKQLHYPDALQESDPFLLKCYESDLRKAADFLSGIGEIKARVRDKDLSTALAQTLDLLRDTPDDPELHRVLGNIHERMGHHHDAIQQYMISLKANPDDPNLQTSIAWEMIKYVNESLKKVSDSTTLDSKIKSFCQNCLKSLEKLTHLDHPSLVYSSLLSSLTRFVRQSGKNIPIDLASDYLQFFQKWDWKNLREEDYQGFVPGKDPSKRFPSLAESVATALYNAAIARQPQTNRLLISDYPYVLEYYQNVTEKFPEDEWIPYHYGKLLIENQEYDRARDLIIRVAQDQMNQFWVWNVLADTFPQDQEMRMACYCRALCCQLPKGKEQFLVSVHENLGDILRQKKLNSEALCEYQQVDHIRQSQKWNPIHRKFDFNSWSKDITSTQSNRNFYEANAERAETVVLNSLPNFDGVILAHYFDQRRGNEMMRIWWHDPSQPIDSVMTLRARKAFLKVKAGDPIHVWVKNVNGKNSIANLILREGGHPWDVYPKKLGVLTFQDENRGYSRFSVDSDDSSVSADWKTFSELREFKPGSFFELGLIPQKDNHINVCCAEAVSVPKPLPSFVRRFSGSIRIPQGRRFGFVDKIFLPESILSGFEEGEKVEGIAVSSLDRVKKCNGWKAIQMIKA